MADTKRYASVPVLTLADDLSSSGAYIKTTTANDWGGNALTTADFNTDYIPATIINDAKTLVEFILIDATTIGNLTTTGALIYKRGLKYYAEGDTTDSDEVTANKLAWTQGESKLLIGTNPPWMYGKFPSKENDETITGLWTFPASGSANVAVVASATNPPLLDTELTTKKYVDDTAIAGAPDATTTVKGIVEIATQAEVDAGTTTGATGASLAVRPPEMANVIQDGSYVYAADSVGTDSYAITLVPAITAYVTGQVFHFKAGTANTGASTLNVNGLGAKDIKKNTDQALETGDIEVGSIITVSYDGTNFQMLNPIAATLSTAMQQEITSALVGGAFNGVVSGTALENITAGQPVKFITDSGEQKIAPLHGIYTAGNDIDAVDSVNKMIQLSDNKIVVALGAGIVRCGTISSGVVTWGAKVTLTKASPITQNNIAIARVDDSTFVTLMTGSGAGDDVIANVCTVSGTTITDANQVVILNAGGNSGAPNVLNIGGGFLAFIWGESNAGTRAQIYIYQISGTSLTQKTTTSISCQTLGYVQAATLDTSTKKFIVSYDLGAPSINLIALTYDSVGNSLTTGTTFVFASISTAMRPKIAVVSSTSFVFYCTGSAANTPQMSYCAVSGTTITNTGNSITNSMTSINGNIFYIDNRIILYFLETAGSTTQLVMKIYELQGVYLSLRISYSIRGVTYTSTGNDMCVYNSNYEIAFISYDTGGLNSKSVVLCGGLDWDRFVGLAAETKSAGSTVLVNSLSGINTSQSSLVPNTNMYVLIDGTRGTVGIQTSSDSRSVLSSGVTYSTYPVGRNISATETLINSLI